jgi:hypothetical protein
MFTHISEVLAASIVVALMMEAASTSEMFVNFYQITRHNIPEDSHLQVTVPVSYSGHVKLEYLRGPVIFTDEYPAGDGREFTLK